MNETLKTLLFVASGGLLLALGIASAPSAVEPGFFSDEGETFFPKFTSPDDVATLEVSAFEEETASVEKFVVHKEDGRWTIPSHHGYPADAKDRMATAAGLLIGLTKAAVRSDRSGDHVALGVIDPDDEGAELKGRGIKVTFRDGAGGVLASLILGRELEDRPGHRFVRVPGKNRVYVANVPGEVSTRFSDWIETDLLGLASWKVDGLVFDNYSVEESGFRAVLKQGERLVLDKKDHKWALEGMTDGEKINEQRIRDVTSELDDLKIVGVRPKPAGLTEKLSMTDGTELGVIMQSLAARGYYLDPKGNLVSNEGDLIVKTEDGITYTLRFGEVVWGAGDALTAGTDEKDGDAGSPEEKSSTDGVGANRYLMVSAEFDQELLEKPDGAALPREHLDQRKRAREALDEIRDAIAKYKEKESALPDDLAKLTEGDEPYLDELEKDPWGSDYVYTKTSDDSYTLLSWSEDKAPGGTGVAQDISVDASEAEDALQKLADDWKSYDEKVEAGKKRARELSDRFGPWYYVIDAESYKTLKCARKDLVTADEKVSKAEDSEKKAVDTGDDK